MEADPQVKEGHAGAVTLRAFRNAAGSLRGDLSHGSDSWAVSQGWVAVTPICLRSDMPLSAAEAARRMQPQVLRALAAAMQAAAEALGVAAAGVPPELLEEGPAEAAAAAVEKVLLA